MVKAKKTAIELAAMVKAKLNYPNVMIEVHRDTVAWHVTTYGSSPAMVQDTQVLAENIAQELRALFDLAD
jgi:hypothetical protein